MRRSPISMQEAPLPPDAARAHGVRGRRTVPERTVESTCREFCERTRDYWQEWVRRLSIGYDWQDAMIRAAITLKLSNFEETGAVVAALTTSIPEARNSGRTLGLPLLLAARRLFRGQGAQPYRRHAHDGGFHHLHARHRRRGHRRAEAGLRRCAERGPARARGAPPQGLSGPRAGARRQRSRRAGSARRLWQRDPGRDADVLRPPAAARRPTRRCSACSNARQQGRDGGARARCRHLGISRPQPHPHPFGGHVLGRLLAAWAPSPPISGSPTAPPIGTKSPTSSKMRYSNAPGTKNAALSPQPSTTTISMRACLLLPELGLIEAKDPRFVSTVETISSGTRAQINTL